MYLGTGKKPLNLKMVEGHEFNSEAEAKSQAINFQNRTGGAGWFKVLDTEKQLWLMERNWDAKKLEF